MLVRISREDSATPRPQFAGFRFVGVLLLLFSLATLAVDVMLVIGAVRTGLAQSYPSAFGEIIHSEVRETGSGKNHTIRGEVRYRYSVDGQEWTGDRVHFHGMSAGSFGSAQTVVETYPKGRKVEVIYNSRDPSDAALSRSIDGLPLFGALCLIPFNLVTLGGLWWVLSRMTGWRSLPLRREGTRWCVLPTNGQPFVVAMMVMGFASISILLVVGLAGWAESLSAMLVTWTFLLGSSGLAFWHTRSLVRHELPLLILDEDSVTWPTTTDAPEFSVARAQLRSVELEEAPQLQNSSSDFLIQFEFIGDDGQPVKRLVLKTHSGIEAVSITDWLEDWAGLSNAGLARNRVTG